MENTIVTIFVVLALIVGGVGGAVFTPNETEIEYVDRDVTVEVPVDVPVETIIEVPAPNQLDLAVEAFMKAVDDEEDEAGNDVEVLGKYNFDEVEVSKVYDEYTVEYDGDETIVNFRIRLRFKEEDASAEKQTFDVTVRFEDEEDTEVTVAQLI